LTIHRSSELLGEALHGDNEAVGRLLEHFRAYLFVIAQRQLDERLRARLDPGDIVQTTFLEAHRDFSKFEGKEINTFLSWLRNILQHNVETAHQRHLSAQKRSAKSEAADATVVAGSDRVPLVNILPSESSSPSQRAMRDEASVELAECLLKLPATQAEALRLRYLEGWPLKAIAERMQKSDLAVAGLLKRGLRSLRVELAKQVSSSL
jgi:RNA polymerase sigma-70 factor (ECF subfamily)